MADVAVIIPTHNRAGLLPAAIDSVLAQQFDGTVEIIVIDDGSTDDTPHVMAEYIADSNALIEYIRQEKEGVVAARNRGLSMSAAPLVAFLDSDDCWHPRKLQAQVDLMRADESVVVCHTSFRYVNDHGTFTDDGPQREDNPCVGRCTRKLLEEDLVIFSSVIARRSAIDAAAAAESHGLPFAPGLRNAQDYDLLLRLSRLGAFAYCREPLTHYRLHDAHGAMGNLPRAYGYHCRVQLDFATRWGDDVGVTLDDARGFAGAFLEGRAESAFWQRRFDQVRLFAKLASELGVETAGMASLARRASRPTWPYKLKDGIDRFLGRTADDG